MITITYKVEYGSWNDGSAQPKTQSLTLTGDASGALEPPAVGNAPTTNCKAGKWKTESGELPATITYADTTDGEITYTYAYAQKEQFTISSIAMAGVRFNRSKSTRAISLPSRQIPPRRA